MKIQLTGFVAAALLLSAGWATAEDNMAPAPAAPPAVISVGDRKAIDAAMGNDATIEGTVSDAQWSATGRVFLVKFKDADASQFQGALLVQHREPVEQALGDLANALEGSKIRLAGKLQMYRDHPEILIEKPEQITIVEKGPGHSPHAGGLATRPVRLFGVYGNLTVTDEQRAKIAAIQQESHEAELAYEKKLSEDADAKIDALLTDDQRKQLATLKAEAAHRFQNAGAGAGGAPDKD
jgi:hypothetical protein